MLMNARKGTEMLGVTRASTSCSASINQRTGVRNAAMFDAKPKRLTTSFSQAGSETAGSKGTSHQSIWSSKEAIVSYLTASATGKQQEAANLHRGRSCKSDPPRSISNQGVNSWN